MKNLNDISAKTKWEFELYNFNIILLLIFHGA
jgi:hypothetical protein